MSLKKLMLILLVFSYGYSFKLKEKNWNEEVYYDKYNWLKEFHYQKASFYLTNCWAIPSAKIIEEIGALFLGTSSHIATETLGYKDGEIFPFEYLILLTKQLIQSTILSVMIDCEGLYSSNLYDLANHAKTLFETGISGINFEDQILKKSVVSQWPIIEQSKRIVKIKEGITQWGMTYFLMQDRYVFSNDRPVSSIGWSNWKRKFL